MKTVTGSGPPQTIGKPESPGGSSRSAIRFLVVFLGLAAGFALAVRTPVFEKGVLLPYAGFIARTASTAIRATGIDARASDTTIISPAFAVEIRKGCDGLEAILVLVSATLAYPFSSMRLRFLVLVTGYLLVFVLNLVRVAGLFLLGVAGYVGVFDFVHTYVAQFAIVTAVMLLWLFWISRDRPRGTRNREMAANGAPPSGATKSR
jgi:exosortase H (IPTLxxWG-CTERM-specific)